MQKHFTHKQTKNVQQPCALLNVSASTECSNALSNNAASNNAFIPDICWMLAAFSERFFRCHYAKHSTRMSY